MLVMWPILASWILRWTSGIRHSNTPLWVLAGEACDCSSDSEWCTFKKLCGHSTFNRSLQDTFLPHCTCRWRHLSFKCNSRFNSNTCSPHPGFLHTIILNWQVSKCFWVRNRMMYYTVLTCFTYHQLFEHSCPITSIFVVLTFHFEVSNFPLHSQVRPNLQCIHTE